MNCLNNKFSYFLSSYKSNLVRGISFRLRIFESSLRSSFMRLVLVVMKFWQRRKQWEADSISRLQDHSGLIISWTLCVNLCSLRWLKPTRSLESSFIPYMSAALSTLLGIVLNSGQLRVIKKLSVIERCSLLWCNLKKIVTFGTQHFVRYSWHVHCLECYWEVSLY